MEDVVQRGAKLVQVTHAESTEFLRECRPLKLADFPTSAVRGDAEQRLVGSLIQLLRGQHCRQALAPAA
jgi:hypothetical protein